MNDAIIGGAIAMTPALVPTVFVAVYAALFRGVARRASIESACGHCGYPRPDAADTCPECGARVDQPLARSAPIRDLLRVTAVFGVLETLLLGCLVVMPEPVWAFMTGHFEMPFGAGPEVIVFANAVCFVMLSSCVWIAVFVRKPGLAGAIASMTYCAGAAACAALFENWASC